MGQETTTLGRLLRITRTDGVVIRLSSTGRDETFDAETFLGDPGFLSSSVTIESGQTPYVDIDFGAEIASDDPVTVEDVDRGLYSRALIEVFRINYTDTSQNFLEVQGFVGNAEFTDTGVIRFDTRGGTEDLALIDAEKFSVNCAVNLGDPRRCKVPIRPADVERSTLYEAGDYVRVNQSGYQNRMFLCTDGGTTAGSAPTFDFTVGNDTTDGGVTWTAEEAWMRQGSVVAVTNRYNFTLTVTESRAVNSWFDNGQIQFTSGANAELFYDVRKWVQSGGVLYLWTRARFDVAPGDTFEIYPGCDKTTGVNGCTKFDNILNYQGFPHLPGKDFAFRYVTGEDT
jgi:hypothetical protein